MNLQPVSSSRMTSVGWENGTMFIKFKDGAIYAYANVSQTQYISFINSSSLGHELVSFQQKHAYHRVK